MKKKLLVLCTVFLMTVIAIVPMAAAAGKGVGSPTIPGARVCQDGTPEGLARILDLLSGAGL